MTWAIAPVGWCAVCLAVRGEEKPAQALWQGTGLCREHLEKVIPVDDLLGADETDETDETVLTEEERESIDLAFIDAKVRSTKALHYAVERIIADRWRKP